MSVPVGRRQFLRVVGVSAVAAALWRAGAAGRPSITESATRVLMGTIATITLVGDDRDQLVSAIDRAFTTMASLEGVLSRHRADTQLAELNRTGQIEQPDTSLVEVLSAANDVSERTGGQFDITVLPLLDAYERARTEGTTPSDDEIERMRALVDWRGVDIRPDRVRLADPRMGISLDGIAKGYVIDRGVAALRRAGVADVVVEVGGDLVASGSNEHGAPWSASIADHPEHASVLVAGGALASSGSRFATFSDDGRLHHIIDPTTGRSAPHLDAVSVIGPDAMTTDALATALMVMSLDEAISTVERWPGFGALATNADGLSTRSTEWPAGPGTTPTRLR